MQMHTNGCFNGLFNPFVHQGRAVFDIDWEAVPFHFNQRAVIEVFGE